MKKLFLLLPIVILCSCERSRINQFNETACEAPFLMEIFGDGMQVIIPNIFTPNGDLVNDIIQPFLFLNGRELESYSWSIYYAEEVAYTSFDPTAFWSGISDREDSPIGEHEYFLEVKVNDTTYNFSGTFYLARPIAGEDDTRYRLQNCPTCVFPDMIDPRNGIVAPTNDLLCR